MFWELNLINKVFRTVLFNENSFWEALYSEPLWISYNVSQDKQNASHTQISVKLHLFTPVVIANIRTYGTGGKNQGWAVSYIQMDCWEPALENN